MFFLCTRGILKILLLTIVADLYHISTFKLCQLSGEGIDVGGWSRLDKDPSVGRQLKPRAAVQG
jgi:hypothetical protein